MSFKTMTTIVLITILVVFSATIYAQDIVSIDPDHKDRIIVGLNPKLDFIAVDCTYRFSRSRMVADYCDKGPILKLELGVNVWLIHKAHSLWAWYPEDSIDKSYLVLLTHD